MTCLDDISSKIPDGLYLEMADKMKRVHDHMNGNKPFHEDTFYYSDDDSELDSESDDDSDSDYNERTRREVAIELIRNRLLDYVKSMHGEWDELEKWEEKVANATFIKRMTATRKAEAIKEWCEKNVRWAPRGEAGELVGHISTTAIVLGGWTWKNLMENGLRAVVMEIGTEEEKVPDFVYYDELSLKTIQKLPAFEKKIYDDYKEECQRKWYVAIQNAKLKVVESKAKMTGLEMFCVDRESELRLADAPVYARDYWESAVNEFWVGENGRMVDNGFVARVELRR